jgi:EmrB/QacA subfamily drug resistance transporter
VAPLVVLLSAAFMELVDVSIVNIALPLIHRDLGADSADLQWIVAGYSVAFAVVLITAARLGDIAGRKRVFLAGMAGFTVASALCGLASSPGALIAARCLQGGFGAVMMPQILSVIQVLYTGAERVRALGAYGAVAGLATVIGPLAGAGILTVDAGGWGWRAIFFVNVVIGVVALAAAARVVPESRSPHPERLDLIGVGLLTLALTGLSVPLVEGRVAGWPVWVGAMLAAGVTLLAGFLLWERRLAQRGGSPLVDLSLFRLASFSAGLAVSATFFATIASFFLVATVFLQTGIGYSPVHAGLTGLPFSLGMIGGAVVASNLTMRAGRRLLSAGIAIMAVGMGAVAAVIGVAGDAVSTWQLAGPLLVAGLGMGLVVVPLIDIVLAPVDPARAGHASGLASMMQPVGGALGVVAVGAVFFASVDAAGYVAALQRALVVEVALLLLTWLLIRLLPHHAARATAAA